MLSVVIHSDSFPHAPDTKFSVATTFAPIALGDNRFIYRFSFVRVKIDDRIHRMCDSTVIIMMPAAADGESLYIYEYILIYDFLRVEVVFSNPMIRNHLI